MLTHAVEEKNSLKKLEECIENAMSKVQAKSESKLCRYIPCKEGYLGSPKQVVISNYHCTHR